jgi:hypothetical protein
MQHHRRVHSIGWGEPEASRVVGHFVAVEIVNALAKQCDSVRSVVTSGMCVVIESTRRRWSGRRRCATDRLAKSDVQSGCHRVGRPSRLG